MKKKEASKIIDTFRAKSEFMEKCSAVRILEEPSHGSSIRWGQCSACGEKEGFARPIPDSYKYCPDCGCLLLWPDKESEEK